MNLGDFEILPGVVISNDDPLNQGRVKACAPTLFTQDMNVDDLFWINPFCMFGFQSFSKLEINSKIWILHNVNNYFEYWYIPMFEINNNMPNVTDTNADVVMSRSIAGEKVQLYYSQNEGFNLVNGNNKINLSNVGNLNIESNNTYIKANENGIELSKKDENIYHTVKAEELINILNTFCGDLQTIATTCATNPFTAQLSIGLSNAANKLQANLNNIKSDFVKIS